MGRGVGNHMSGPIDFSPEALEAFRTKVRKTSGVRAIRLGVRGGSCNGLQYVIKFDYSKDPREGDVEWNPKGWDELGYSREEAALYVSAHLYPINFRLDKKSATLLSGSRVTWHKSLMREGFEFENPNEASRCGCGHSFSAK